MTEHRPPVWGGVAGLLELVGNQRPARHRPILEGLAGWDWVTGRD